MAELRKLHEYMPLNEVGARILLEFATEIAPQLIPLCMVQAPSMIPNQQKVQLSLPMLSGLTFQAAGFLTAEYMKRCSGEVATDGLNKEIPVRE